MRVVTPSVTRPSLSLHPNLTALWHRLRLMRQIANERRQLASLDERGLRDLNLTPSDVRREVERPFWDLPVNRFTL